MPLQDVEQQGSNKLCQHTLKQNALSPNKETVTSSNAPFREKQI